MANLNKNPIALTIARRSAGLTRQQLAEKSNLSEGTITRWEQRRTPIEEASTANILAVATALGCDVEILMDTVPELTVCDTTVKKELKKNYKSKLATLRKSRGLTNKQLAEITGISSRTIENFEHRPELIKNTAVKFTYALSKALGVSIAEIID